MTTLLWALVATCFAAFFLFSWWVVESELKRVQARLRASAKESIALAASLESSDQQVSDLYLSLELVTDELARKTAEFEAAIELLHAGSGS